MTSIPKHPMTSVIKQSPPVDLSQPYQFSWIKGKHIIITGGASGFGEAFAREWARAGASIILSDINVQKGDQVARDIRKESENENVHFIACDVRDWHQQVELFKSAVRLSPHGGIDVVVANAGIAGIEPLHNITNNFSTAEPKKPDFKVLDINLYGALYTTQLALYWLQKNTGSSACTPESDPDKTPRDRLILLVGSLASLAPIPTQPLYGTAKHGILGLFRSLRASSFFDGVRVNMICPYFIETPILPVPGRLILAGGAMGQVSDVVDAASRLTADCRILGRALCVGPRVRVKQDEDGGWIVLPKESPDGEERAVWEAYADDFEDTEEFTQRMLTILKGASAIKGWAGWLQDIFLALKYGIFG